MEKSIKILIVDDHPVIREGIKKFFEGYKDIELIGEAKDGDEAIKMVEKLLPNVVVMDVKMPKVDGIKATRIIKEKYPEVNVILLSVYDEAHLVNEAIKAGASSFILKEAPAEKIISAIRDASAKKPIAHFIVGEDILKKAFGQASRENEIKITARETQVLELMAKGKTNKKIAQEIFVSEQTVKVYVTKILQKLKASNRAEAVAIALQNNILPPPPPHNSQFY